MMIERRDTSARSTLKLALAAVVLGSTPPPTSALNAVLPMIELRRAETLGIGPSPSKAATAKVDADLLALHAEYQAHLNQTSGQGAAAPTFKSSNPIAPIAGGSVVIDTAASGDPEALAADLRALGAHKVAVFGRMVSARMPIPAISGLKRLSSLQFARPAYAATQVGAVTSQGDAAMRADIGRTAFGVDGTGVMVGTLSDSYDCLGTAAAGVASGDLPADVIVLEEGPCPATDEGRGMMELIRNVAPGASQAFHTAFNGQADFAQGIIDLATTRGAKVINDDVIVFAEPFFQDGIVAQAVNTVKGMGVAYFSSAGNEDRQAYEAPFRPSNQFFNIGFGSEEAHDFDPGPRIDTCQQITIPVGSTVTLVFQWDQPFFSVSVGAPGSTSDLDIVLTNAACDTLLDRSAIGNIGGDPFEVLTFTNAGPATTFGVIILRDTGPDPGLMMTVNVGSGSITIDEFDTKTGASWGHSAALGGLGVGAADYRDTPAFGQDPPLIEDFSSAGGIPILFDTSGNRLATPEDRQQPDITAPDGADTTFFPPGGDDPDATGFPNFFGTSAAAPHAAGTAALMIDLNPSIGPDAVYSVMKNTAVDMDDPATSAFDSGFDCRTGFGLIQAEAALSASLQPPPPPPSPPPAGCFVIPPPPPVLCNGRAATIVGTDGDDRLLGTPGNDVIHGLAGDDVITGLDGNDVICGGPGRDQLSGNRGKDRLFGDEGKDVLKGGAGSDRLFGQSGNDAMNGQSGFDRCNGGSGNDRAASCENTARVP